MRLILIWRPRIGEICPDAKQSPDDTDNNRDDAEEFHQLLLTDLGEHGGVLIDRYWDDPPERARVDETVRLGTLTAGQQFAYVFDLGDDWAHLCTVADQRIDPQDALGITPDKPLPYWGWGSIPDQYGRRWDGDDGETRQPPNPQLTDLPALHPGWGPRHR